VHGPETGAPRAQARPRETSPASARSGAPSFEVRRRGGALVLCEFQTRLASSNGDPKVHLDVPCDRTAARAPDRSGVRPREGGTGDGGEDSGAAIPITEGSSGCEAGACGARPRDHVTPERNPLALGQPSAGSTIDRLHRAPVARLGAWLRFTGTVSRATIKNSVVVLIELGVQRAGGAGAQRAGTNRRHDEVPDQGVSCCDGSSDVGAIGRAVRHVQLGRDQLVCQANQTVATSRFVEDAAEFRVRIRHRSERQARNGPLVRVLTGLAARRPVRLPEALRERAAAAVVAGLRAADRAEIDIIRAREGAATEPATGVGENAKHVFRTTLERLARTGVSGDARLVEIDVADREGLAFIRSEVPTRRTRMLHRRLTGERQSAIARSVPTVLIVIFERGPLNRHASGGTGRSSADPQRDRTQTRTLALERRSIVRSELGKRRTTQHTEQREPGEELNSFHCWSFSHFRKRRGTSQENMRTT